MDMMVIDVGLGIGDSLTHARHEHGYRHKLAAGYRADMAGIGQSLDAGASPIAA